MKMTVISATVEEYLSSRRVMGFELCGEGYQLRAFARFAKQQGHVGVPTLDLMLKWAQGAIKPGPVTAARRLEVLRPFLKYCRQFDSSAPTIPAGLCGPGHRRLAPHIYTEAEVSALLDAARELKPEGLRSLTYMTLFGLLASTGMRLSEAVHLKEADVNLTQPAVAVRETKFKKSRLVPIHASTAQRLAAYQKVTRNILRGSGVETLFLTAAGQSLPMRTIHSTFDSLRHRLGWVARGGHPHPRIHDLRHTFICRAMLRSQQGGQVDHDVNAISTYVGHAKVSDTYWYISATPELLNAASVRFSRLCSGDSQ